MSPDDPTPPICARIFACCDRRPIRAELLARRLLDATPADTPDHPWALLTLGWCLMVRERLGEANATLERARALLEAAGHVRGALGARHGLLLVGLLHGLSANALPAWDALAEAYVAHGLPLEAARVRTGQVRCLNMLWRAADALALAEATRPVVDALGTARDHALLARMLGMAHLLLGTFPQADEALSAAEAGFRLLRQPGELARTWVEQSRLALVHEDLHASLALSERAHRLFVRLDMPLRAAYCEKHIGVVAAKLGRPDRAIAHQLAAREAFAAIGQPLNVADCTINLGLAAFYSGLFELALAAWRQAEAGYTASGVCGMVLLCRRNQAEALWHLGQLDTAAALLTELIPIAERLDARGDLGEILHVLGEVLLARGAAGHAYEVLRQAEVLFEMLGNRPAVGRARLVQGWLALAQGDLPEAEGHFQQAASDLVESPIYHWRARYGLGRIGEQRGAYEEALEHYRQACAEVSHLRRHLAEAHASSALFQEAGRLVHDTLHLAAIQGDPLTVLQIAEQQRAMGLQQHLQREPVILPSSLQVDYEARRSVLRALALQGVKGPELDAAVNAYLEVLLHGRHVAAPPDIPQPEARLDLAALRAALGAAYGDAWTALVYLQANDNLLAISLDPTQIHLDTLLLDRELQRMIERASLPRYRMYTYQDLPFQSGQRARPWADLAVLGERLIPLRVWARLGPTHHLLIAPGGPLHSLPWAALRVNDQWLIEQAVIQLIPGLQLWAALAQRPRAGDEAMLVGVSQFGGRAAGLSSAIPSLDLAQRHWPGPVRRLEDGEVTRASLREAGLAGELKRYGLLHFATHGQLTAGRGMLAHVKLADDDLLADEVAQLQLGGALVVLAACEGALGEALPGEELVSLSWAFLAAGARDVIASLWQLHDLTILPMLEPLYAALASGRGVPAALAEAQRACIAATQENSGSALGMPYVWASLCATGAGVRP